MNEFFTPHHTEIRDTPDHSAYSPFRKGHHEHVTWPAPGHRAAYSGTGEFLLTPRIRKGRESKTTARRSDWEPGACQRLDPSGAIL